MTSVVAKDLVVEFPMYWGRSRSLKNTFFRAATGGLLARDAADRVVIRALNSVNFDFREGDRVGIVGHNGSGKSPLLRTIAGAYEPVSALLTLLIDLKSVRVPRPSRKKKAPLPKGGRWILIGRKRRYLPPGKPLPTGASYVKKVVS